MKRLFTHAHTNLLIDFVFDSLPDKLFLLRKEWRPKSPSMTSMRTLSSSMIPSRLITTGSLKLAHLKSVLSQGCSQTTWSKTQVPNTTPRTNQNQLEQPSTRLVTAEAAAGSKMIHLRQHQWVPADTPPSTQPTPLTRPTCLGGLSPRQHQEKPLERSLTSIKLTTLDQALAHSASLRIRQRPSATLVLVDAHILTNWEHSRT